MDIPEHAEAADISLPYQPYGCPRHFTGAILPRLSRRLLVLCRNRPRRYSFSPMNRIKSTQPEGDVQLLERGLQICEYERTMTVFQPLTSALIANWDHHVARFLCWSSVRIRLSRQWSNHRYASISHLLRRGNSRWTLLPPFHLDLLVDSHVWLSTGDRRLLHCFRHR
jgi:hypothetical protein